jgi:hypothetical protein
MKGTLADPKTRRPLLTIPHSTGEPLGFESKDRMVAQAGRSSTLGHAASG